MTLLDIVLMLLVFAALFVLFILFNPARSCSGNCGQCTGGSCHSEQGRGRP